MANTSFIPVTLQAVNGGQKISATEVGIRSLRNLGVTEANLEEFVRQHIYLLFPNSDETLFVVGQQVRNKEAGRADLVALDGQGNTVLIELKRDKEDITTRKEAFEFQAIRYAASYALLKSVQEIVQKLYVPYIEKHKLESPFKDEIGKGLTSSELGSRLIRSFLESNNIAEPINRKQRIILIASSYDPQTLSACAWLASNGIDIRCITVLPVEHNGQHFFQIEQLIPPPSIEEYLVEIDESFASSRVSDSEGNRVKRASLPRMSALIDWGIIAVGDVLHIKGYEKESAIVVDARLVSYGDQKLSYNQWGKTVTGWAAISIYEWAVQARTSKTLDQLRSEKMEEQLASGSEQ